MLRNCYESINRRDTSRAEVLRQARQSSVWFARACANIRALFRARVRVGKLESCELESCELESWKLWLRIWHTTRQAEVREYRTLSELRAGLDELNGNYLVCEEHHGEEGQDGHTWTRHYGKELKA